MTIEMALIICTLILVSPVLLPILIWAVSDLFILLSIPLCDLWEFISDCWWELTH